MERKSSADSFAGGALGGPLTAVLGSEISLSSSSVIGFSADPSFQRKGNVVHRLSHIYGVLKNRTIIQKLLALSDFIFNLKADSRWWETAFGDVQLNESSWFQPCAKIEPGVSIASEKIQKLYPVIVYKPIKENSWHIKKMFQVLYWKEQL